MKKFILLKVLFLLVIMTICSSSLWSQRWVLTDMASLTDTTDVFLIVDVNSGNAMSNNNGTGAAPAAVSITLNAENTEVNGVVPDNIKWNISHSEASYHFHPEGSFETWLYCINSNNGVRVGTNLAKNFIYDSENNKLKNEDETRWIGVYNSSDWRCYTTPTQTNILNTNIKFFKYVTANPLTVTFNAGTGTSETESLTESSAGSGIILPESTSCGSGWIFEGWAETSVSETTTEPVIYTAGSTYYPSSNSTLYAVYSKTEGGGVSEGDILTVGFEASEGFIAGSSYNNTTPVNLGAEGRQWAFVMGTSSQTGAIDDLISAQMRSYLGNENMGSVTMLYDLEKVTKVTFNSMYSNGAGSLNLYYSTNSGSTWSEATPQELTTSKAEYTYIISATGEYDNVRIRFENPTINIAGRVFVDNVKFSGMLFTGTITYNSNPVCITTPELTVVPSNLPFGEVAVNETSEIMSVAVTGENLTAPITYLIENDSDNVFSVSGAANWNESNGGDLNVTFTPVVAQEYTANLVISSEGVESKTVALSGSGTTSPILTILSPENGSIIYSQDFEVEFELGNFELGSDGKIKYTYTIGNGEPTIAYHTIMENISLTGFVPGDYSIVFELVDMSDVSIIPEVSHTINFTTKSTPSINITSPSEGQVIYAESVEVLFTVDGFVLGTDGKLKYSFEGSGQESIHETNSPIILSDLVAGDYIVNFELVDMEENSLIPNIIESLNFTIKAIPQLSITSPENNSVVNENQVSVSFVVENFVISGEGAEGKVAYKLEESGTILYTTTSPVIINNLIEGENNIYLELVDNEGISIVNPVTAQVTVIYDRIIPEIIITNPGMDEIIYSNNVDVTFEVNEFENFGTAGKVKYTLDGGTPEYTTELTISLTGLTFSDHDILLELVDMDGNPIQDAISASVTFSCVELFPVTYELVTSSDDLVDGGRYLVVGINSENYYALGWQKTSNRHAVPVILTDNTINIVPASEVTPTQDNVNPYEITLNSYEGNWTLYDAVNEKYLRPRTGSNNGLQVETTSVPWEVSVAETGVATIICADGTYPNPIMRFNYNSGAPLFACYASATQTDVYLYKAVEEETAYLRITSPENDSRVSTSEIQVEFTVRNFEITGENPDGKVAYKLGESGTVSYATSSPVTISGLILGSNTIYMELVNVDGTPLENPIVSSVTVIYETPEPSITIISPEDGEILYSQDVNIVFSIEDFIIGESAGKIKYILDGGSPIMHTSTEAISLTGLSYASHAISLELVNNDGTSLTPPVSDEVTFICEEETESIYRLVTSETDLTDNGKYILVGEKDGNYFALGWQKTNNRHAVPVTVTNNTVVTYIATEIIAEDDVNPYEITISNTNNGWVLYDGLNGKYLRPRTGSNNGLQLDEAEYGWEITFGEENVVNIIGISETYPNKTMQFNRGSSNTSPLFACYATASQSPVYLYKAVTEDEPLIVITSPESGSTIDNIEVDITFDVYNFVLDTDGKVKYSVNGTAGSSLVTSSPISLDLEYSTSYNVELELVDMDGNSFDPQIKSSVNFTTGPGVFVDNNSGNRISIYPNPVTDVLYIDLPEEANMITLINIAGQAVMEIKPVSKLEKINVENMEPGVYFVKVIKSSDTEMFKVVIR